MAGRDNEELLDVAVTLLEQAKQHDENIQQAVKALKNEKQSLSDLQKHIADEAGFALGKATAAYEQTIKDLVLKQYHIPLESHKRELNHQIDTLREHVKSLDWRFSLIMGSCFFAAFLALLLAVAWYIPSFDEIGERKAQLAALDKAISQKSSISQMQIANCAGQTCVRIMRNQCGYGKNRDFCVIDPK